MKQTNKRLITLVIAVCIGCTAGLSSYLQLFSEADTAVTNWIYDHTFFLKADNRITVIAIDEKTNSEYGNYTDWDRTLFADAVSVLSENKAAVIGLDLTLPASFGDNKDGDTTLADACKDAGNVVAAAGVTYESPKGDEKKDKPSDTSRPQNTEQSADSSRPQNTEQPADTPIIDVRGADNSMRWEDRKVDNILFPYDALTDCVSIGVANASQQSADGFVRNASLTVTYDGTTYDSFAVALYRSYQDALGKTYTLPEADHNGLFGFHMIQDTNNTQVISFSDLLAGSYDSSLIDDHIVIIGEYESADDSNPSAISKFIRPNQNQQEIMTQVSILQSLLSGNIVVTINPLLQAVFFALMTVLFYLLAVNRKLWVTIFSHTIVLCSFFSVGYVLNYYGYRLSLLTPVIMFPCVIFIELLERTFISIYEKKKMEWTLKMYVDAQVVDAITQKSPVELASVSERRHIAVLFVDIRGFTTISEALEPEQVVEILNEYLSLVAAAIAKWGGTLDKFIGDAAMAFFNAPNDQPDYVFRAVCAASEIVQSADSLQKKFEQRFQKTVTFGIGVNCGDAIVGNIGCSSRMDYTAIGDTVNVAARLEANAAPRQILVSQSVMDVIAPYVKTTFIGSLSLKGKANAVDTYQIDQILSLPEHDSRSGKEHLLEKTLLHSQSK